MKIRLIHGIHSKEGDNNMAQLLPHLEKAMPGSKIELFSYGFMGFWAARWDNNSIAQRFAAESKFNRGSCPEVWITHSNGGAIAYLAVQKFGATPDMIINVNPALDRWRTAPVPRVETIHSEQDRAVDIAQWLPFHIWGDQGKVGYKGKSTNTININASKISGVMAYKGHTGLFDSVRIGTWANFMALRIEEFMASTVVKY